MDPTIAFTIKAVILAGCLIASCAFLLNNDRTEEVSCAARCNRNQFKAGASCQCNKACVRNNDCCSDYFSVCLGQTVGSCVRRCTQRGTVNGTCQCNKRCLNFGDCCPDYTDVCYPGGRVSDKELEDLAEQLISLDTENNATQYINLDLQGRTSRDLNNDVAPNPLLTVSSLAFSRPTIQKLVQLHDNYDPVTSVRETYTPEEEKEISDFVDQVFNTKIMQTTQEFLVSKKLPSGRDSFVEMWFELYSRGNGVVSSSGFEHVFLGESKAEKVSGFHNWEYFAVEEANNRINYMGYMDFLDLGERGSIIEHRFDWRDERKPVSSMFVGTSPELELALYTVCFHSRPRSKCPVSLNGRKVKIQTYTIGSRGQHVASAYPDLSD